MKKLTLTFFILIECILYFTFLIMDINYISFGAVESTHIKYICICLCVLYSSYVIISCFSSYKKERQSDASIKTKLILLLAVTQILTLTADTFLLLLDGNYAFGIFCFCLVQTGYAIYLKQHTCRSYLILRLSLYFAAALPVCIIAGFDIVLLLSAYSYTQLLLNVYHSFKKCDILTLGLLLFLLCDTCVGLSNIDLYLPQTFSAFSHAVGVMMWLFYLPSQVIIVYYFTKKLSEGR